MTLEEYKKVRWAFVVVVSVIFSQTIYYKNYFIPIAVLLVASLVHLYLRRQVKEILADERDYALAGRSALMTLQVYSWIAVVAMFIFYALRDINPSYEPIGMALAFSTCLLLLINAFIFHFINRVRFSDKKLIYSALLLALFAALFVAGIRGLSGEDDWICEDGQWVQHGNPDFPAPETLCK